MPGLVELQASIAYAIKLVLANDSSSSSTTVSVGVGLIMSASGKIADGLFGIQFTAEADGMIIFSPHAVQAVFDIQVDVTIAWFLDINFDVQTQYTQALP